MAEKLNELTYAASKSYTDASMAGGGAVRGKNCKIQSITDIPGGKRVTFLWSLDNGTEQTSTMDVMNGSDAQAIVLPTPSASNVGQILQYVGASTEGLINGYFYQCVENSGTYTWEAKTVQAGGGASTLGGLTDVTLSSPTSGQILKFNGTEWENANAGAVSTGLGDLADVDFDNLTDGQMIAWDAASGKWKNVNSAATGPTVNNEQLIFH